MFLRCLTLLILCAFPTLATAFELEPLDTRNLSPAVIGFGLPSLGPARILPCHSGRLQLSFDLVSNFTERNSGDESLLFDGETYRTAVAVDYGFGSRLELGAELPLISHQRGFLDGFIEDWHSFFGLPQGGRNRMAYNQLAYRYSRVGEDHFNLDSETSAIGDLSLRAGWQLWRDREHSRSLALRTSLKLPTGDADKLTGSGSTDLALWLSAEQRLTSSAGPLMFYGGGGGLISSDGALLPHQRRNLIGLINLGCGWQPWSRLGLQLQFDGHSPFYQKSSFDELSQFAGQLSMGGSFALREQTTVELAVIEDVIVDTAPDVVFHLALRHQF